VIDRLPRASWRLLVATVALGGFALASNALDAPFEELGTLACLATGLLYLALAVVGIVDPRSAWTWPRGAIATVLLLVGALHVVAVDGGADQGWPFLQHVVTPVLVLADLAWQPGKAGRPWWPFSWAMVPAAYFGVHRVAELAVYDALDPFGADYGAITGGLLVATLGSAFLVFALVRLRQSAYARDIS
jgi:hypothetical protein